MGSEVCLKSVGSACASYTGRAVVVFSLLFLTSTASAAGLQPLTPEQMGAVHGQALLAVPLPGDTQNGEALSLDVLEFAAKSLLPVMGVLTSDSQVQGVHFPQDSSIRVREDGGLDLPMPSRIERITLNNIRLPGSSHNLGNIAIHNIRFHPDSRLALRVH